MKVSLEDAYKYLELPFGAGLESVTVSYKRLASTYNPEQNSKHEKKFREVSCAYQRITGPGQGDNVDMNIESMKTLFKNVFSMGMGEPKTVNQNGRRLERESSDSESSTNEGDTDSMGRSEQLDLTQEEREKNARELITEEEKEKRKSEKRKAKRKKRKEKKKQEKEQEPPNKNHNIDQRAEGQGQNGIRSSDDSEGIDPNAAFVKQGNRKNDTNKPQEASKNTAALSGSNKKYDTSMNGDTETAVLKSRQIAVQGNEMAQKADYPAAIRLFTEAIKLGPGDYRFYGNRSYCYDRIMQFDKALEDADKCIELSPEWPKGYFRKGRALAGLKQYQAAEKAFMQVLKLDRNCEEAEKELSRVRMHQIMDMGFSQKQAEQAIRNHNSVNSAVESLLAGVVSDANLSGNEVYYSDEDDDAVESSSPQGSRPTSNIRPPTASAFSNNPKIKFATKAAPHEFAEEKKMDPTNPEGLTALWVGNVLPSVKDSDLQKLFERYGQVSSVRCLPEKYCAFVNFKTKEAAGKAMNALQHHEVEGQHLLIKFPDNPIQNGSAQIAYKNTKIPTQKIAKPVQLTETALQQKASGPVNGDECYFWRTTGCSFGAKCRWKHVQENRGVDRKPWQRVKE